MPSMYRPPLVVSKPRMETRRSFFWPWEIVMPESRFNASAMLSRLNRCMSLRVTTEAT